MEPVSYPAAPERSDLEKGAGNEHRGRSAPSLSGASPHPWDGYLIGPENELAMAAAQALARGERDGLSPLVVYGSSGVGKSRLLAGLVTEQRRRQPDSTVAYLDAQAFVAACLEAAATPGRTGWSSLRHRFRSVDLFVIEDLEGLERGPLAWEELVHTMDALETIGAAMAFSTRTTPAMWPDQGWPRRLVARLMGGLLTPVTPPSLASRRRYVLRQTSLHGVALEAEAVEILAQSADGYRTLDGWISRLALESRLKHNQAPPEDINHDSRAPQPSRTHAYLRSTPLNPHTLASILADERLLAEPVLTIDTIAQSLAARHRVALGTLRGPSRRASIVRTRHLAMYLARTLTGTSFNAIGAYFGGRDAATVRHACKTIAHHLNTDPTLAAAVASFLARWSRTRS